MLGLAASRTSVFTHALCVASQLGSRYPIMAAAWMKYAQWKLWFGFGVRIYMYIFFPLLTSCFVAL